MQPQNFENPYYTLVMCWCKGIIKSLLFGEKKKRKRSEFQNLNFKMFIQFWCRGLTGAKVPDNNNFQLSYFSSNFNTFLLTNCHLYELLMSQFRKEFFLWKRESNSSILEKKMFHLILMQILDIISGIMVSVFTLSAVYHGFEPKASQTKD